MIIIRRGLKKYLLEKYSFISFYLNKFLFKNIVDSESAGLVNKVLIEKTFLKDLSTTKAYLGGNTNHGLFFTFSKKSFKPVYVTKKQNSNLNQIEDFFLRLVNGASYNLAPELIFANSSEGDFSHITTEYITPPLFISSKRIVELYFLLEKYSLMLKQKNDVVKSIKARQGMYVNYNESVLKLVCNVHSLEGKKALINWMNCKLENNFSESELRFIKNSVSNFESTFLCGVDESYYGFVHGDFKPDNMMLNNMRKLVLIDFQHACYGPRVWDLAFLGSKGRYTFNKFMSSFLSDDFDENQKKLFAFLYIVSNLMYVEVKDKQRVLKERLMPAAKYLVRVD